MGEKLIWRQSYFMTQSSAQPREEGHVSAHFFLVIYQDNKTVIKVFW